MEVADEFAAWLDANIDPELDLATWRRRLFDAGWAVPGWPARWGGRDLSASTVAEIGRALADRGAPGVPDGVGTQLVAPTLIEHGADGVCARLLRPTAIGEIWWCQLFSEPVAGSDLASLATRAERDGDEWSITGQKLWTTSAHHADFGLLLARTDAAAPRHQGLTAFALPLDQPGVEVRPLRQMNGYASFNEVFMDGARVGDDLRIGAVRSGWAVALTTLAHERRLAPSLRAERATPLTPGRLAREAATEAARISAPYVWYPQRAGRVDLLVERAIATGRAGDALIRQDVARAIATARTARWSAERAQAARRAGRPPGAEGSVAKLASSRVARRSAAAHANIGGLSVTLASPDAPADGVVTEVVLSVPAVSIAGGTDQIQRNILAERVLGLPKEPTAQ